ncbi:MAG: amidohydrolase [Firmicutes bacterium]|nr:amidohydrolase [Bacillota bacterium]
MTGTTAIRKIDAEQEKLIDLSKKMWEHPETAYNEVEASKWTAELLKEYGFEVETGAYGLPTCVVGRWGSGKPVVGFLGELDALPGLSQKVCDTKDPVSPDAPGQGCGHNLLNVACLAGALGAKAEMEEKKLPGTLVFYACPAEEVLTGKVFMARNGAFKDLDICFAWHGSSKNQVSFGTMNGLNSAIFHYSGRTAHAGGAPWQGRSALDAAEIANVGANYLREHVTPDIRIHYSYKEAGTAPNIVPDRASVWYYVRGLSREAIEDAYRRLVLCAEGAAHMTETDLEVEFLGGCYNTMPNRVLTDLAHDTMEEIGVPVWTDEEKAFADSLNRQSPRFEEVSKSGELEKGPIHSVVCPVEEEFGGGSTDVGDVDHICPCCQVNTATYNLAAPGHSWQITACAGMSIGFKGMLFGGKVLAASALKAIESPELIEKAKAEFAEKTKKSPYKCPIGPEIPVPQPKC